MLLQKCYAGNFRGKKLNSTPLSIIFFLSLETKVLHFVRHVELQNRSRANQELIFLEQRLKGKNSFEITRSYFSVRLQTSMSEIDNVVNSCSE